MARFVNFIPSWPHLTICNKSDKEEKQIANTTQENKVSPKKTTAKKNQQNDKAIGWHIGNWNAKRNALEQSGRPKTLEVTGIPLKDCENCIDIIYKICKLTSTNTKNQKLKSTTWWKMVLLLQN